LPREAELPVFQPEPGGRRLGGHRRGAISRSTCPRFSGSATGADYPSARGGLNPSTSMNPPETRPTAARANSSSAIPRGSTPFSTSTRSWSRPVPAHRTTPSGWPSGLGVRSHTEWPLGLQRVPVRRPAAVLEPVPHLKTRRRGRGEAVSRDQAFLVRASRQIATPTVRAGARAACRRTVNVRRAPFLRWITTRPLDQRLHAEPRKKLLPGPGFLARAAANSSGSTILRTISATSKSRPASPSHSLMRIRRGIRTVASMSMPGTRRSR